MHCPPVLPLLVSGLAVLAGLLASRPESAQAEVIVHQGLQFSDEEGGFTLLSVSGTGTLDDPIVVVEEVAATRNITLVIRGFSRGFGNRVGTQHVSAFAMKKIVINRSDRLWRNFQMELREVSTRRSPYSDGLSFGQNSTIGEGYTASSFPHIQRFDEPEDSLGFGGAEVLPGDQAEFFFVISDMSPVHQFYLVQVPLQPLSEHAPNRTVSTEWASLTP